MKLTLFYTMIVVAYLMGSISSAVIVCKLMGLPDPRATGSKNPGATNVMRIGGKIPALLVLVGDVLKGLIPVLLIKLFGIDGLAVGIIAGMAVIGHMYPIFFGFQGGKGVATGFGALLGLSWPLAIGVLIVWIIVFAIWRYVSLASLFATAAILPLNEFLGDMHYSMALMVIALLIIIRHRKNIANLLNGTEHKFGIRSS